MNRLLQDGRVELICRWILGITFVYAGFQKIMAPAHFAKIIYGYYLFPALSINLMAIVLPVLEMLTGAALLLGFYPRSAAIIINLMLLGFIIAISINLIRGHEFDCGCFSMGEAGYTSSARQLLVRDMGIMVPGLFVMFFRPRRRACLWQTGGLLNDL